GDAETFDDLAPFHRLAQIEARAADDDVAAVIDEVVERLLEREQLRPSVDDRDHVHAEGGLQLGELVEVVEDHLPGRVALDLDPDPPVRAVAVVLDVGNALAPLVADERGDALDQADFVALVGDLGDDDRLAALGVFFDLTARAQGDAAAPRRVGLHDPRAADDEAARGEIRAFDDLEEIAGLQVGVVD